MNIKYLYFGLMALIVLIVTAWNVVTLAGWRTQIKIAAAEQEEITRPTNLEVTVLTPVDCEDCWSATTLTSWLRGQNVIFAKEETLSVTDDAAAEWLDVYQPTKLPAIVIQGEIDKVTTLNDFWSSVGAQRIENAYLINAVAPPYKSWPDGQKRGDVTVTLIGDQSCDSCYDVNVHRQALANFGVTADDVAVVDRADVAGMALVDKYQITAVPTVIFNGDVEVYTSLHALWPQIGSIEPDGTHVLRELTSMGVYYDLRLDREVAPVIKEQ